MQLSWLEIQANKGFVFGKSGSAGKQLWHRVIRTKLSSLVCRFSIYQSRSTATRSTGSPTGDRITPTVPNPSTGIPESHHHTVVPLEGEEWSQVQQQNMDNITCLALCQGWHTHNTVAHTTTSHPTNSTTTQSHCICNAHNHTRLCCRYKMLHRCNHHSRCAKIQSTRSGTGNSYPSISTHDEQEHLHPGDHWFGLGSPSSWNTCAHLGLRNTEDASTPTSGVSDGLPDTCKKSTARRPHNKCGWLENTTHACWLPQQLSRLQYQYPQDPKEAKQHSSHSSGPG